MSRNKDRWGEDDDPRPRRPRERGGLSPVAIVLLAVGGLCVVGALACGGLMWLGYTRAQKAREAEEADLAETRRRFDEVERAALGNGAVDLGRFGGQMLPPPKPGFRDAPEPPPQPKATNFATDDPARPNHWRVMFRSKRPELWNTNTQDGDDFAIPLTSTQIDTKYLRLRRMDTGEAIIIPMTLPRIGRADLPDRKARWNGEGKDEFGGYHLGIAEGPVARFTEGQGTIGVLMDGFDANPGSGFGHAHHVENGGQRYSWKGKEIEPTAFEVAVTTGELTEAERAWLVE